MPRVAFKEADVARLVRGAIKGGMAPERLRVRLIQGEPAIEQVDPDTPTPQAAPNDDGAAERIQRLIDGIG